MDVSACIGFRQRPGWLAVVAILLAAQAFLTLRQFSPDYTLNSLLNDQPLLNGRHPLHFYHGMIGAKAWRELGTSSCFDPAYQAGYPKTPVFDGGSRPSEFFQLMGGQNPAAYKTGLAICAMLAPLAFVVMARGIGFSPGQACFAGFLAALLWWSEPCQVLFHEGDVDLMLGGLCLLLHATWFVRFERMPGLDSWLMMTLFAALAWYTQPLLVAGFLPLLLLFYLWVATRQGAIWHLAVVAAALVAFGLNASWLIDWVNHLWLYLPCGGQLPPPAPFWPTLSNQWSTLLPHDAIHIGVAAAGLTGLLVLLRTNRSAAWLLGLATLKYTLLAAAGKFWPVLIDFGSEKVLLITTWCLVLPAAAALLAAAKRLNDVSGASLVGALWLAGTLAAIGWYVDLPRVWLGRDSLQIGLNAESDAVIRALLAETTPDARTLWEDRPNVTWTPLLAKLSGRPFLGGLDPEGHVEHMYARLSDGNLCGRPLASWTDSQIQEFCDRYNVSWAVCWTSPSIERFQQLTFAHAVQELQDGGRGVLFRLDRKRSYFLKGRGQWDVADSRRIALAEVIPENGEVILSMHYQANMRVSPGYVRVERDIDADDPIPFIRLRLAGPVARIAIVWDDP